MAIQFEFYKTPDPSDAEETKYHARAVTTHTVDTNKIIEEINERASLTPGDVKAALRALSDLIALHLSESRRVHLEGIGYFQPTLKYVKEINPHKTRAQSIWFKSVKFRADNDLKMKLKNVATERSMIRRHSAGLTPKQIDKKLTTFFQENEFLTRKLFEELCGMTRTTAAREIRRLKGEGKIKNINTRQQPFYIPEPGYYSK